VRGRSLIDGRVELSFLVCTDSEMPLRVP
jgi:hypothetical protein